jgi:hypothetical protein
LVNLRVITLCSMRREITVLMAALRLPPGDQPTSDVVGVTFIIPLDPESGMLGQAECARLELGALANHPHSGVRFQGRTIAEWPAMRAQVIAAHRRLPNMPAIGWDCIATEQGAFILEANAVWHADVAQQWGLLPLGESAWPKVMLEHLPPSIAHLS